MATKIKLSKIEKISLRECWQNEASDFTPWLASEDNITLLADALGMNELEVKGQEEHVGPFRADILCVDPGTDKYVLIENQLEKTDHNHLGQILTYAAGLDAVTIIWVAERFTEEHRATIDWLNRITDKEFNFFGVEIELIKIGDSPAAPMFNVIAKPNGWSKDVRSSQSCIIGVEVVEQPPHIILTGSTYSTFFYSLEVIGKGGIQLVVVLGSIGNILEELRGLDEDSLCLHYLVSGILSLFVAHVQIISIGNTCLSHQVVTIIGDIL